MIYANSVARTANYYAGGAKTISGTKEKHLAEAIQEVKDYIGFKDHQPLKNGDKQDAIFRQLCISQVTASSDEDSRARSNCDEVIMTETIVCVIPKLPLAEENDLPPPDIKNAYISQGPDFLYDAWIYNSNPYHATQPVEGATFSSKFKVINRGRKIKTRGKVTISFEPHVQVLADRMIVNTADGSSVYGVKVVCTNDKGKDEATGYRNVSNDQNQTG